MEPEHHGMREGELSTMKVRSKWSSLSNSGFGGLTGTVRAGIWSHLSLGMLQVCKRCSLNAGEGERGGRRLFVWNRKAWIAMCFVNLARDFELMAGS